MNGIPMDDFEEGKFFCSVKPNDQNMIQDIVACVTLLLYWIFPHAGLARRGLVANWINYIESILIHHM